MKTIFMGLNLRTSASNLKHIQIQDSLQPQDHLEFFPTREALTRSALMDAL